MLDQFEIMPDASLRLLNVLSLIPNICAILTHRKCMLRRNSICSSCTISGGLPRLPVCRVSQEKDAFIMLRSSSGSVCRIFSTPSRDVNITLSEFVNALSLLSSTSPSVLLRRSDNVCLASSFRFYIKST